MNLRPYQIEVVDRIEQALGTAAAVLLVAPTGSGKTVIAADIISRMVAQYKTVLFLAHRREIIMQTSAKLTAAGVRHGIIMAGIEPRPMECTDYPRITSNGRSPSIDGKSVSAVKRRSFANAHRARR